MSSTMTAKIGWSRAPCANATDHQTMWLPSPCVIKNTRNGCVMWMGGWWVVVVLVVVVVVVGGWVGGLWWVGGDCGVWDNGGWSSPDVHTAGNLVVQISDEFCSSFPMPLLRPKAGSVSISIVRLPLQKSRCPPLLCFLGIVPLLLCVHSIIRLELRYDLEGPPPTTTKHRTFSTAPTTHTHNPTNTYTQTNTIPGATPTQKVPLCPLCEPIPPIHTSKNHAEATPTPPSPHENTPPNTAICLRKQKPWCILPRGSKHQKIIHQGLYTKGEISSNPTKTYHIHQEQCVYTKHIRIHQEQPLYTKNKAYTPRF